MFFGDFSWAFVHLVDQVCCCQVVTPPPGAGFRVLCPGLRDRKPPECVMVSLEKSLMMMFYGNVFIDGNL